MKVEVRKTVSEEVDVRFPIYGHWFNDVDDGRLSWETHFRINDQLEFTCVTEYTGNGKEFEVSVERLKPNQVGQYLKHTENDATDFDERLRKALARLAK